VEELGPLLPSLLRPDAQPKRQVEVWPRDVDLSAFKTYAQDRFDEQQFQAISCAAVHVVLDKKRPPGSLPITLIQARACRGSGRGGGF